MKLHILVNLYVHMTFFAGSGSSPLAFETECPLKNK